ncbi:16746_t:CDS:1, partial [Cetraspora pellucida]
FDKFFKIYKHYSSNIIKTKVLNFFKYQTATKYAEEHKKLLLQSFIIESITSLQKCTLLVRKLVLFNVHIYKNSDEHKCTVLPSNTEHNFQNLSTYYFDQSFKKFPVPISDKSSPSTKSNQPV